jgi:hypothetical protein
MLTAVTAGTERRSEMTAVSNQIHAEDTTSLDEWETSLDEWETEGGANPAPLSKQQEQRAQRWEHAKDLHWHSVDYTDTTQVRSNTEHTGK